MKINSTNWPAGRENYAVPQDSQTCFAVWEVYRCGTGFSVSPPNISQAVITESLLEREAVSDKNRPDPDEHLMIVYYDVLLVDDESLLGLRQTERLKRLEHLVCRRRGHAEIAERIIIDLAGPSGPSDLRRAFAASITSRSEGLVLKPDEPYFDFTGSRRHLTGSPVKLKKEYIGTFGDVGDFAVVGASYNPVKARSYQIPGLKYTHFYIACLTNKEAVQRHHCKPHFTVVECVELNETLLRTVVVSANPEPIPIQENQAMNLRIPARILSEKPPTVVFPTPLVFDVRCFSFDKQGNTGFWSPRFPAVTKVHFDRDYHDTITFTELQAMAENAVTAPDMEDSQELLDWIQRLEGADPRGIPVDAITQSTISSMATPSPRARSARASESPTAERRQKIPVKHFQPLPPVMEEEQPRALITPPESSALMASQLVAPGHTKITAPRGKGANKGDSAHDTDSPQLHRNKQRTSIPPASNPTLLDSPSPDNPPSSQRRTPLMNVDINTSQPQNRSLRPSHLACHQSMRSRPSDEPSTPSQEPQFIKSCQPVTSRPKSSPVLTPPHIRRRDVCRVGSQPRKSTSCRYVGRGCILGGRDFLLSPWVEKQARITEQLLPAHGITTWVTDPKEWLKNGHALSTHDIRHGPQEGHGTAVPGKQRRKVCFVERRRRDATRTLLSYIEKVNLRLPDGEREWVEVYDWRVLEEMTRREDASDGPLHKATRKGIWGKFWVGLA